jgi:hypothetical protein
MVCWSSTVRCRRPAGKRRCVGRGCDWGGFHRALPRGFGSVGWVGIGLRWLWRAKGAPEGVSEAAEWGGPMLPDWSRNLLQPVPMIMADVVRGSRIGTG